MAGRLFERFRWWAFHLFANNPKVCNASVGCWAAWNDLEQIRDGRWRVGPVCIEDSVRNGNCWCGKLGRRSPVRTAPTEGGGDGGDH